MNTKPLRTAALVRVVRPVSVVLIICCSFALAASSSTASTSGSHPRAPQLTGAWSGTYRGTYRGTFTLRWTQTGTKLSGTIKLSSTGGKVPLTGTVRGNAIRFGTVGTAAVTYSGSVSGKSMSGAYRAGGGGGSWSAHKTS